jgi:hypothetical protein
MVKQPDNATELCRLANERPCITWDFSYTARELKKGPWKWKQPERVAIGKRDIRMTRGEALKAAFVQETKMALTVTGTAEFKNEGKLLETVVKIQPSFPDQHDRLELVAKLYGPENANMENGTLVLRRTLVVTEQELQKIIQAGAGTAMQSASSTQSGSANDSAPVRTGDSSASGASATAGAPACADEDRMADEGGNDLQSGVPQ